MVLKISDFAFLFSCPDDKSSVVFNDNNLQCTKCKRKFEIKNDIIDMRPKNKINITTKNKKIVYLDYYDSLFEKGDPGKEGTFGLSSKSISEGFVNETLENIQKNLTSNDIVCDVGAATGDYSIPLAKNSKLMIHCDLDINGLLISKQKALEKNISNILLIRCDYFQLPLMNKKIDLVYSIDVVERGIEHDSKILNEMCRIIKSKGTLIFDYHTKERSKLTRIEPSHMSTYSNIGIKNLIKNMPFTKTSFIGTGFVPQLKKWSKLEYSFFNLVSKFLKFPPGRQIVICLID